MLYKQYINTIRKYTNTNTFFIFGTNTFLYGNEFTQNTQVNYQYDTVLYIIDSATITRKSKIKYMEAIASCCVTKKNQSYIKTIKQVSKFSIHNLSNHGPLASSPSAMIG